MSFYSLFRLSAFGVMGKLFWGRHGMARKRQGYDMEGVDSESSRN